MGCCEVQIFDWAVCVIGRGLPFYTFVMGEVLRATDGRRKCDVEAIFNLTVAM